MVVLVLVGTRGSTARLCKYVLKEARSLAASNSRDAKTAVWTELIELVQCCAKFANVFFAWKGSEGMRASREFSSSSEWSESECEVRSGKDFCEKSEKS